jgi:DNA processing protein
MVWERLVLQDRFYWAALHIASGLGPRSLLHLYRHFRSGAAIFRAGAADLRQVPQLSPRAIEQILLYRKYMNPDKTASELMAEGIRLVMLGDPDYPGGLAEIADPPVMLYLKGALPHQELPLIAVVGTRRASPYGLAAAGELAQGLAENGWGVVSGLARGVDAAAHFGALNVNGYTMAILGCGINVCYPRENKRLRDCIQTAGGLLSELPPAAGPRPEHFPVRNRIVSGCCLGTLVVEAGSKSGALITAYQALEQGRDVFAVPGPITSDRSRGTNSLIRQGAKLVENIDDVLTEYAYLQTNHQERQDSPVRQSRTGELSKDEDVIFKQLGLEPLHIDQLAGHTGLTVSVVGGLLTMLEIKGLVRRLPGHYFVKTVINKA